MPQTRECDYCGAEIEPGTGTMFVRTDGTTIHYCSAKCEKNADLGREARDLSWTDTGRDTTTEAVEDESEPEETAEVDTEADSESDETTGADTEAEDAEAEDAADTDDEDESAAEAAEESDDADPEEVDA
jgi:large subunit ribosomal protein L24e